MKANINSEFVNTNVNYDKENKNITIKHKFKNREKETITTVPNIELSKQQFKKYIDQIHESMKEVFDTDETIAIIKVKTK